ncbi:MAG: acetylglutamate kinase [Holosporales bacterium]
MQIDIDTTATALAKATILAEALPYMRRYAGRTFIIKYGGHAMGDASAAAAFAKDVVLLKQIGINPIVVHGGGPQIGAMLERLKIKSDFVDGLRVTDAATVEIVEMVLSGAINKAIVAEINRAGGLAVGLSGKDANLIEAKRLEHKRRDPDSNIESVLDLGFVGEPTKINPAVLATFARSDIIPVIAPIGVDSEGRSYNINADTAAGAIAAAVRATRFFLLTDVGGVLDANKKPIADLSRAEAEKLIHNGTISGGMIPKVRTCLDAVAGGVEGAVILDGRLPHAVLLEVFTSKGVGTILHE